MRRSRTAALFVSLGLAVTSSVPAQPPTAPATKPPEQLYTILIFERPASLAERTSASKADAYWSGYDAFAGELAKAGALRGGSALHEEVSVTVRGAGGADRGVQGARLGGYMIVAAPSLAAAEALARRAPAAAITVEVRPHRLNPHMTGVSR